MLTKTDLQSIGKVVDSKLKEIATDISAIQARVADIETDQLRKIDFMRLYSLISSVEKRVAAVEGIILKSATKDDLKSLEVKDDLKNFVTKVDTHFRKLHKELKSITRFFDSEYLKLDKRIDKLDQHIDHPPIATS